MAEHRVPVRVVLNVTVLVEAETEEAAKEAVEACGDHDLLLLCEKALDRDDGALEVEAV